MPRLGRVDIGAHEGDVVATVAGFGILGSDELDMEAVKARIEARRGKVEAELKKIEGKLANERFVENAPAEVVAEESEKAERLRVELAELG